jgi:hypothetical protein
MDMRASRYLKLNEPEILDRTKGERMTFNEKQLELLAATGRQLNLVRNTLDDVQTLNGPGEVAGSIKEDPYVFQAQQLIMEAGRILYRIAEASKSGS